MLDQGTIPHPGRAGRLLTTQYHCWPFLPISVFLPEPMLPLPSMALSQFGFPIQGLISPNVTELTYKRETVLETFVMSLQHTKGLHFYSTKTRASEKFLLSSALVPCRAAQTPSVTDNTPMSPNIVSSSRWLTHIALL